MIKIAEKKIYLVGSDGRQRLFSAEDLENELCECFSAAGNAMNMFLAADIALALEYELNNSRDGKTEIGELEFDELLHRLLNNLNLPEISQVYRERRKSADDPVLVEGIWVDKLAGRILPDFSPAQRSEIASQVRESLAKLELPQVTGNLLVEMLRTYAMKYRRQAAVPSFVGEMAPAQWREIESGEIFESCAESVRKLNAAGVILCDDVKRLLPSLKIQIFLKNYAALIGLVTPVTELEFYAPVADLNMALAALIHAAEKLHGVDRELPIYVYFPDLDEFLTDYFEIANPTRNPLRSELTGEICRALNVAIK